MKPGDLLYLPRGQYHYALADDGGCIHIAFGVTYPIGIDVVSYLFERMIADPLSRGTSRAADAAALAAHLARSASGSARC
jgi:ribosomal protein L16 Arg81 hydroxylase